MKRLIPLNIPPGILTESTDRDARGRWKDGDHIRWRNGIPQKLGGWTKKIEPIIGRARAIHDWASLDAQRWAAIGTHEKLYLINGNTLYNITPLRDSGQITDPFTTTNGSKVVNVEHPGHGVVQGDNVFFENATAVGGITIDGEYKVLTITDANNYTISHSVAATSGATGGGTVDYEYEISAGKATSGALFGYGTGPYSASTWGTPRDESDTTIRSDVHVWTLDNWGEDLIACPYQGRIYHWDRTLGPETRATLIANAPLSTEFSFVSQENRHLVSLGSHNGVDHDQMLVQWCSQEDFNDWTPVSTNTAGSKRLDRGSKIISAIRTRSETIVFTDEALYGMRFIGPEEIFSFQPLGESLSIMGPNAAIDVGGVVYFMASEDFYIYDGLARVLPCEVRNTVYNDLNLDQRRKIYCSLNRFFSEVWWLYPSADSEEVDRYVIYNYMDKAWYYGTIDRTAMHDQSALYQKPYAVSSDGVLYLHEDGVDDDTDPLPSFIESFDFELDDGNDFIHVDRLIPDFLLLDGSVDITVDTERYPHGPTKTKGPYTVTSDTEKTHVRARGRQVSIKIESSGLGDNWRMGTWRARGIDHGKR